MPKKLFFKPTSDTCFPFPGEEANEIEWRLRYGEPSERDIMYAASTMAAYRELLEATHAWRDAVVRKYKVEVGDARSFRRR